MVSEKNPYSKCGSGSDSLNTAINYLYLLSEIVSIRLFLRRSYEELTTCEFQNRDFEPWISKTQLIFLGVQNILSFHLAQVKISLRGPCQHYMVIKEKNSFWCNHPLKPSYRIQNLTAFEKKSLRGSDILMIGTSTIYSISQLSL